MTAKLGEWIDVDTSSLPADDVEVNEGVEIHIGLSPYDIPEAVRGSIDSNGIFNIELKYLSDRDEPTEVTKIDPIVSFETGVSSQSLYRIHVNLKAVDCESVTVKIVSQLQKSLSQYATHGLPKKRQTQFKAAENVMKQLVTH